MNVVVDWLDPEAADGQRLKSTEVAWPDEMPLPVAGDRISIEGDNVKVYEGRVYRIEFGEVALHLSCGSPGAP